MSYGRHPYYWWCDGRYLHLWSDRIPEDCPPVLAADCTYNEQGAWEWARDCAPHHMVLIPLAAIRQLLRAWVRDHPEWDQAAMLAAIEADFAEEDGHGGRC
ncbi:MAG: hypothetical protein K6U87_06205 [Firmicutes bacterium]|nr:hypothetical protein [Bacillota bacterium]